MKIRDLVHTATSNPQEFLAGLDERLEKAEQANKDLNAFLRFYPRTGAHTPVESGPLSGTVFAAKDCFQIPGSPLSYGLNPALVARCFEEAAVLRLLRKQGAFLIGSTNLDEACLTSYGDNRHFGRVINPAARERSPLGSSAGSAAAVSAGLVDFALGSDSGGSVRAPAAACGVCAIKGSRGMWPREGMLIAFPEFEEPGIITFCLDDLSYLYEVCLPDSCPKERAGRFSIMLPCTDELSGLSPAISEAFESLAEGIRRHVSVIRLEYEVGFRRALDARRVIAASTFSGFVDFWRLGEERLCPAGLALLELGRRLSDEVKNEALLALESLRDETAALLSSGEYLLTPTIPEVAPLWVEVEGGQTESDAPINFYLALANVCGLPAVSFPLTPEGGGTIALQLMGARESDFSLINCARRLQNTKNSQPGR